MDATAYQTYIQYQTQNAEGIMAIGTSSLRRITIVVSLCAAALFTLMPLPAVAAGGDLLWENRGQAPGLDGVGFAVAAHGSTVVTSGQLCSGFSILTCDWFMRASDASTGATLWEDRLNAANAWDRSQRLAVDAGIAFASGWIQRPLPAVFDFVIRAYDVNTGTLLWEHQIDRGGRSEFAEMVVAHGGRVFVVGRVAGSSAFGNFTVLAFDARTGDSLWESVTDEGSAFATVAKGNKVYVAGLNRTRSVGFVRAFDASSGALVWRAEVAFAQNVVATYSLEAEGDRLFAAFAARSSAGDLDALVQAYDARTGALAWQQRVERPGSHDAARTLAIDGDRLLVGGREECDPGVIFCTTWVVRGLESATGSLLWEHRLVSPLGDAEPHQLVAQAGNVYAGGYFLAAHGRYEWVIQAHDTRTGELLWQERIDGGGDFSAVHGLDLRGSRLFATGVVNGSSDRGNLTIRAYNTN